MANGYDEAIKDLREYRDLKTALINIPDEIAELEQECGAVKSVRYDKTPVMGGTSGYEDALILNIDRRNRLAIRLDTAKSKINRIDRGLSGLTETERLILRRFYIDGQRGYLDRLTLELGYERAQIYRIKDAALQRFVRSMWGVVDA